MKKNFTPLYSLLLLFLFSCGSPVSDGGSVSDIGNPCISGIVLNSDGSKAQHTEVTLIHNDYNPITDSPISDTNKDTTDAEGKFSFSQHDTLQNFNLEAKSLNGNERALQNNIYSSADTNCTYTISLTPPGQILVQFDDTTNLSNGHLYIPGSSLSRKITPKDITLKKDRYYIPFAELPQGAISKLHTLNNKSLTTNITDSFTVSNNETVAIRSNTFWRSHNNLSSSLPVDSITALLATNTTLYAGTSQSGLYTYDQNQWSHIPNSPSSKITSLCQKGNKLWIGTNQGIYSFENNTTTTVDTLNLPSDTITALALDSLHNIWIGTKEGTLLVTDSTQTTFDSTSAGFSENNIVDISITPDSTIYLCTPYSFGTYKNNKWNISKNGEAGLSLTSPITAMAINSIGKIYLATPSGIHVKSQTFWYSFDKSTEGMKNCNTQTIVIDNNSKAWAGTSDTAYIYKLNTPHVYDYNNLNTPWIKNTGSIICATVDTDNTIYYGTSKGGILEMWEEK